MRVLVTSSSSDPAVPPNSVGRPTGRPRRFLSRYGGRRQLAVGRPRSPALGGEQGVQAGVGERVGRRGQQPVERAQRLARVGRGRAAAGGQGEDGVPVHHRVDRGDGPGHPVVADRGQPARLGLGQGGVGQQHPDGGGQRRRTLFSYAAARAARSAAAGVGQPLLAVGPQPAGDGIDRRAGGVHHHGRAHRRAVVQPALGVAEAALEPAAHRAGAGADHPGRRTLRRGGGVRAGPELGGRPVAEGPAAAEVEDHRGRHDGHHLARVPGRPGSRCRPAPAPPSPRRPRPDRTRCRRSAPRRSPARPRSAGPAGRSPGCPDHRRGRPPRPPPRRWPAPPSCRSASRRRRRCGARSGSRRSSRHCPAVRAESAVGLVLRGGGRAGAGDGEQPRAQPEARLEGRAGHRDRRPAADDRDAADPAAPGAGSVAARDPQLRGGCRPRPAPLDVGRRDRAGPGLRPDHPVVRVGLGPQVRDSRPGRCARRWRRRTG